MLNKNLLTVAANVNVSIHTVIRRIKEVDYNPRRAARKFFLSDLHTEMRFEFAAIHAYHPAEWWSNTIFSDEKTFGYFLNFKLSFISFIRDI